MRISNARFRVSNYRCFGPDKPLIFELTNGFISILGANNAGKSAVLRFFYEMRPIWAALSQAGHAQFEVLVGEGEYATKFHDVIYPLEPFHKFSPEDTPIEITITLPEYEFSFCIRKINRTGIKINNLRFKINGVEVLSRRINIADGNDFSWYNGSDWLRVTRRPYFELFKQLEKMIYIPAFRNIINVGEKRSYGDITTGTAFIKEWDEWKNGPDHWRGQRIQDILTDIRELFEFTSLDVSASADRDSMQLTIDGQVYKLHEVGSGIAQFILVFASAALREPSWILIDEPELNLHPSLQSKFTTSLAAYSSNGVIFGTHSIGLARSISDRIYSVRKTSSSSIFREFETTPNYAEFMGELNFSAYQELGVEKILLCEGPTEVKVLQQFLRKLKKDKDIVVVSLGGDSMINTSRVKELAEFIRLTPKVYLWIDSEKTSADVEAPLERRKFIEECKKLKIKAEMSLRRAMENYFPSAVVRNFTDEDISLTEFEEFVPSNRWGKNDNWKLAKEMSLIDLEATDLGKFLKSI